MKVSVQQAERMTGKSRTKIYKDIKSGALTTEKNDKDKVVIDVSELSRVYDLISTDPNTRVQASASAAQYNAIPLQGAEKSIEIQYLEAQIKTLKEERGREREQLESRIESLEGSLKRSQDTTLLLEKKDTGAENWQQSLKALESRIANQEKDAKSKAEAESLEKIALEKQLTEQKKLMEEQGLALKTAKEDELKRKEEEFAAAQTWVSKMFSKKNRA